MVNHLIHTITAVWSHIFPPSSHYVAVKNATPADIVKILNPQSQDGVSWLSSYHHPLVQACIASAKFEHNMRAVMLLGVLVETYIQSKPPSTLLIPIPLHKKRERARG